MAQAKQSSIVLLTFILMLSACAPSLTTDEIPAAPTARETHTPFAPGQPTETPAYQETHAEANEYEEYGPGGEVPGNHARPGENQAGFGSRFATGDLFLLSMVGVPQPPAGQTYQGWLVSDGADFLAVGILNVTQDGRIEHEWVSPNGENLISTYRSFQVTVEGDSPSTAPQGRSFFYGGLEPETWQMAQNLFVQNSREPATPLNNALVPGLASQLNVAIQHIHNAENAAKIGALAEMRNHMEHTINIIEGAEGARFKDYNGDGAAQNPGDGFGAKGYAREIASLLDQDAAREDWQKLDAYLNSIQDICEHRIGLQDVAQAQKDLADIEGLLVLVNASAEALMDDAFHFIQFDIIPEASH